MLRPTSPRVCLAAVLLLGIALPGARAQAQSPAPTSLDARTLFRVAPGRVATTSAAAERSVRVDVDAATLTRLRAADAAAVTLPIAGGGTLVLDLERRDVLAPGARITRTGDDGAVTVAPDVRVFRGRVRGDAGGWAVLSVSRVGVLGLVDVTSGRWIIAPLERGRGTTGTHVVADAASLPSRARGFDCAADDLASSLPELPRRRGTGAEGDAGPVITTADRHVCDLAVDCDYEFFLEQGSNVGEAIDYAATLVGVMSGIYENDLNVQIRASYINVWTTAADPYTQPTTQSQLTEFTNYWNGNRGDVSRHLAHLLSGRSLGGGVANLDVLCERSAAYGVSQVDGFYSYPTASTTWDAYVLSHEVGHNFGSNHTQSCVWQTLGLTPVGTLLDSCFTPEGGCYSGPTGIVPGNRGTVMSYCHLLGPINSVLRLQFHPACVTVMRARAEACLPVSAFDAQLDVAASVDGFDVTLSWNPSPAPGVLHYDVYRNDIPLAPVPALVGSTTGTTFLDPARVGKCFYRVRAVRASDVSGLSIETLIEPCPAAEDEFASGTTTLAPIVADLDADGIQDLVVVNGNAVGTISVMRGSGDGGFLAPVAYPAASRPTGMVATDVNDDGILDVVVSNNELSGQFSVLLGTGTGGVPDGGFAAPTSYAAGVRPSAIATGDFNEDGIADVAVANNGNNSVSVALGQGSLGQANGTFAPATLYGGGVRPVAIVPGDFNEDGITDLAVQSSGSAFSALLMGQGSAGVGDGTFVFTSMTGQGNGGGLAAGDWNGDGITDLAHTRDVDPGFVTVLLGQGSGGVGNGTFAAPVAYPAGHHPTAIAATDYDQDGVTDLVVAHSTGGSVGFMRGEGDGSFDQPQSIPIGTQPLGLAFADLDADSIPDLIGTSAASVKNVAVRRWTCAPGSIPVPILVAPNGGELWLAGTEHTVAWSRDPRVRAVHLELTRNGGATWERVASDLTGTSFVWSVTDPVSTTARMRVVDTQVPQRRDDSNAPFTVAQNPLVDVGDRPAVELAIRRVFPNPSRGGELGVSFSLPGEGDASIELFDPAGRRLRHQQLSGIGAGAHVVRLGGGRLASGVYLVRLTHEGRRVVAKVAVLE